MRGSRDLALNLTFDFGFRTQLVPHAVDLIQNHHPPWTSTNMITPHVDIALGYASVGRQNKQDRMRVGNQVQGQLWFRTNCVQARRVNNDQTVF